LRSSWCSLSWCRRRGLVILIGHDLRGHGGWRNGRCDRRLIGHKAAGGNREPRSEDGDPLLGVDEHQAHGAMIPAKPERELRRT